MPSKSSSDYLERRRRFLRPSVGGMFQMSALQSHLRPVVPLPALLPPDTPKHRVITELQTNRIPYTKDCIDVPTDCGTCAVIPHCGVE